MPTPRPHYKERIAHAEGYEIESREHPDDEWEAVEYPLWSEEFEYRVKPEVKPDLKYQTTVYLSLLDDREFDNEDVPNLHFNDAMTPNLRLTFDGETGKLKSAEVIGD